MKIKPGRLILLALALGAVYFAIQGGEYGTSDLVTQRMEKRRLLSTIDSLEREVRRFMADHAELYQPNDDLTERVRARPTSGHPPQVLDPGTRARRDDDAHDVDADVER